jgi:hypothetical protein
MGKAEGDNQYKRDFRDVGHAQGQRDDQHGVVSFSKLIRYFLLESGSDNSSAFWRHAVAVKPDPTLLVTIVHFFVL